MAKGPIGGNPLTILGRTNSIKNKLSSIRVVTKYKSSSKFLGGLGRPSPPLFLPMKGYKQQLATGPTNSFGGPEFITIFFAILKLNFAIFTISNTNIFFNTVLPSYHFFLTEISTNFFYDFFSIIFIIIFLYVLPLVPHILEFSLSA